MAWRVVVFVVAGLATGFVAGWLGTPPLAEVESTVRTRFNFLVSEQYSHTAKAQNRELTATELQNLADAQVELAKTKLHLGPLRRDWIHEVFSTDSSRFMVEATLVPNDVYPAATDYCFHVEYPLATHTVVYDRGPGPCGRFGW
jgi:hypothetical protein